MATGGGIVAVGGMDGQIAVFSLDKKLLCVLKSSLDLLSVSALALSRGFYFFLDFFFVLLLLNIIFSYSL